MYDWDYLIRSIQSVSSPVLTAFVKALHFGQSKNFIAVFFFMVR